MTDIEPVGPYVFQPYGSVSHPDRATTRRLYGIAGLSHQATIKGLTKEEAEAFLAILRAPAEDGGTCEALVWGSGDKVNCGNPLPCEYHPAEDGGDHTPLDVSYRGDMGSGVSEVYINADPDASPELMEALATAGHLASEDERGEEDGDLGAAIELEGWADWLERRHGEVQRGDFQVPVESMRRAAARLRQRDAREPGETRRMFDRDLAVSLLREGVGRHMTIAWDGAFLVHFPAPTTTEDEDG